MTTARETEQLGEAEERQPDAGEHESAARGDATAETEAVTDTEAATDSNVTAEPEPEPAPQTSRRRALPKANRPIALIVAAALALTGLGVWFTIEANELRNSDTVTNTALVDTDTTNEVTATVTNAVNQIFSYSYDTLDRTREAAQNVLRGPALHSYMKLFGRVSDLAPDQRIELNARVVQTAVTYLAHGEAKLLVFLDQTAKRAGQDSPVTSAARLSVTVKHSGQGWVITELSLN